MARSQRRNLTEHRLKTSIDNAEGRHKVRVRAGLAPGYTSLHPGFRRHPSRHKGMATRGGNLEISP